jgi:hypothetical protein
VRGFALHIVTVLFLVSISCSSVAKEHDIFPEITPPTVQVDPVKEAKIAECMEIYINLQSKSYTKIVQNNLYDLIHNFNSIVSKIYGKKKLIDETPYEDKIGALAKSQCEAYYVLGVLK